jgi:hypothetical protein
MKKKAPTPTLGTAPLKQLPATERARLAIEGIGPGEVCDGLHRISELYPTGATPRHVLAEQVEILALAFAKAQSDLKARAAQGDFYKEYLRMVEEHRELRAFLRDHFPDDLEVAVALNMPLLNMVKATMLMLKKKNGSTLAVDSIGQ